MKKIKDLSWDAKFPGLKKLFKIMKLTTFLILISMIGVFASNSYSQSKTLNLNMDKVTVREILSKIEDQSEYHFMYSGNIVDIDRVVSINVQNAKIDEVLQQIFNGTDVNYTVKDRFIVLRTSESANTIESQQQQARSISGKVVDSSGSPLPGVTILIKGTTKGIITDIDGRYTLSAVPNNAIIVFSFVGMQTQEISPKGESIINIKMVDESVGLDEVVAIGYGTKKKADIIGSVAVMNTENLQSVKSVGAAQAIQGMASGVNVTQSGVPGNSSKILVRGVTSFGDNDPLVIVDGIPQSLNYLSTNDIESIQVLKDAGAASIYGVRGANGVILVTTKKGKSGAPVVTYEGSFGMQFPLRGNVWNTLNSEDYMKVYNIAYPGNEKFKKGMPDYMYRGPIGAGVAFEGDAEIDPSLYHYESPNQGKNYIIQKVNKQGTDWFHELFNSAPTTQHNITASGGTDKSKYLFSLGFIDQQGTLIKTRMKRYSARINTEYTIGDKIRVGENANIIHRQRQGFSENSQFGGIVETLKLQPIIPVKDIAGNWGGTFGGPDLGDSSNPVANQSRGTEKDVPLEWFIIGNAYAEFDFLKNLTFRSSIGYNIYNSYSQNYSGTQVENVQGSTNFNSLDISSGYSSEMTFTNTLNYHKTLNKHKIDVLFGTEAIKDISREVSGSSSNFFSDSFNYLDLDNGTESIDNSSSTSKTTLFSIFGRLDYSYDSKYLLGMTLRRDGSSKFGADSRYGVFPSFSAAWRLSQENYMKNISWLNDLKIRASYGVLGSQNNVSASNAFSLYNSSVTGSYYDITGTGTSEVQGFYTSRIGNLKTSWEKNIVTNIGLDATLFGSKLDFSFEYYKKSVSGLLFTEQLPAVIISGTTAPTINIGDIQNTGIDVSVTYRGKINNDFKYSIGANVTNYKNKCVDLPDPGYFTDGDWQGVGTVIRNQEGHPVSSFYGYKVLGLFNSQEEVNAAPTQNSAAPGRFRYADISGPDGVPDGAITTDDRTFLGNPNPDFTCGLNLNFSYKNFDLFAFFYGSYGNKIANLNKSYLDFMSFYGYANKSNDLLNAWTPENTNTNIPKIETAGNFSTSTTMNSFYVEDGSFLKLKTLQLGYTFNPTLIRVLNMSKLRLYTQLANVFTLTKYSGLDPELVGGDSSGFGMDSASYPNNEFNVTFGVSLTF